MAESNAFWGVSMDPDSSPHPDVACRCTQGKELIGTPKWIACLTGEMKDLPAGVAWIGQC